MIKRLAHRLAPRWLWRRLRGWRMRRMLAAFRPYTVEHSYGGVALKLRIADPLARGWYDRDWDPLPEVALLRRSGLGPGACVFDLGAHQGVVAMILANVVGPGGQVVAVEALPHNARACRTNVDLNGLAQVRTVAAAVADRSGELNIALDLDAQVEHTATSTSCVRVAAVTVDGLAERYGPPDVLFIDVEGYECHALRGARRTLERHPACFVEVHVGCGLEPAGGSVAEIFQHLSAAGHDFFAWTEQRPTPAPVRGPDEVPPGRFFLAAVRAER
jgi:FkbM family methyltransferase